MFPLRRFCPERLSFAALVIGSMSPDFGYYFRQFPLAHFAHTALGTLTVCLPSLAFDSTIWKTSLTSDSLDPIRLRMVDDLLHRHRLRGMRREEVASLLGTPPKTDYFRNYDFVYWLGPERGYISVDSEWLAIKFGEDGRVIKALVVSD